MPGSSAGAALDACARCCAGRGNGEPVFQAYIAYCAICRGPCRGAPPPKVAYARPGKKKTKVAQGGGGTV